MTEKRYTDQNTGSLFKNDRKEKPGHPDYKGSITIDGVEYWLSSWLKEKDGKKFLSLSANKKEPKVTSKDDGPL